MHGDRSVTDEQGACDLPVAVAAGQEGEHVPLAVGEVEPGTGRRGPLRGQPEGQPGPARQVVGQGQQRSRLEGTGQLRTRAERPGGLIAPSSTDRRLGLTQPRVGLPVRLAGPGRAA